MATTYEGKIMQDGMASLQHVIMPDQEREHYKNNQTIKGGPQAAKENYGNIAAIKEKSEIAKIPSYIPTFQVIQGSINLAVAEIPNSFVIRIFKNVNIVLFKPFISIGKYTAG